MAVVNSSYPYKLSITCTSTPAPQDSNKPLLPTKIILPKKKPMKWSTGVAPGEYGGPPVTTELRRYWGGEKEDPITSDEYIWNNDFMPRMKRLLEPPDDNLPQFTPTEMEEEGENLGQMMNSLHSINNKTELLQTNIEFFETMLTNLTNSVNNQMIDKVAAVADGHHASLNLEQPVFRLPKINFPSFDGRSQNPRAWINKCEHFFILCPVPETHKVLYASFHLEGRPETRFRSYYEMKGRVLEWRAFADDICERFGRSRIDVLGDFRSVQQSTTVMAYLEKFEEKLADVIWEYKFDEKFVVSNFIAGLNDEIKFRVKMFNPTTFSEVATIASLEEAALNPIIR